MDKALALIALLAILWAVNYLVVFLVGLCLGVTITALQATGVLVAYCGFALYAVVTNDTTNMLRV